MARAYLFGFACGTVAASVIMVGLHIISTASHVVSVVAPAPRFLSPREPDFFLSRPIPRGMPNTNISTEMKNLQMDVYGLPAAFLDSTEQVNSLVERAIAKMTKIHVVQKMTYHFQPSGLTS